MEAEHLIVFSHVPHHDVDGVIMAHGGFVREIDIWAKIFKSITVVATSSIAPVKSDVIPYSHANIEFISISTPQKIDTTIKKLIFWLKIPVFVAIGLRLLRSDSVVMARGPDNFGFIGALVGLLARKKRFAKYAGQWEAYMGESFPYRFQRWFYGSRLWNSPVWVNTAPNSQKPNVVSLLNASLSREEWIHAGEMLDRRSLELGFRLLYVGRISPAKGIDTILNAVSLCIAEGLQITLYIVGDGPDRAQIEQQVNDIGLTDVVVFCGWIDRERLFELYSESHCLVSGSRHQGLDKVILEAMSFGLPIIGTSVSVMPFLIDTPKCGLLVEPDDPNGFYEAIRLVYNDSAIRDSMGRCARQKSADYLRDDLEEKYRVMLRQYLGLTV